ncbi:relaxase, partial [Salmonella enterica]|nr:relaxase [Salmonella enterica]
RTTQKAAQVLNRVKKQYHKEPIKTYNKSIFNSRGSKLSSGSIGRILDHAETANAATNKFRLKSGGRVNSRATKLEEMRYRLGIKKSVIQSKNKEKTMKEEIKKKTSYSFYYENRFKSKLKENLKKEQTKTQQEDEQNLYYGGFKLW